MTTLKLEKLPFYTLLIFIVAGSIGAGYFYTRSFLALSAVLYGVTATLEAINVSLLLPVSLLFLCWWWWFCGSIPFCICKYVHQYNLQIGLDWMSE
ncbi:hypothetical protein [Paenibacillus sp. NPDC101420]|uniref:hypothetical protein n=1 Tax=Paenibacillus sp. NPDC101420 TaxID=3390602 RepID=UPI003D005C19